MPRPKQPHRPDGGYRNYKFRTKWDGRIVAGIHRVSPLRRTVAVIEYRQGTGTRAGLTFGKEVRLEVYDDHDRLVIAYNIPDSHPFQSLTLENEGWERDVPAGRHSRRRRPRP